MQFTRSCFDLEGLEVIVITHRGEVGDELDSSGTSETEPERHRLQETQLAQPKQRSSRSTRNTTAST